MAHDLIGGLALIAGLASQPGVLAVAVVADLALGDPEYRWHPVRLIGGTLRLIERGLRRCGLDGYGGGIALFISLALLWVPAFSALVLAAGGLGFWPGWVVHALVVYSLLALGDLVHHVWAVERALSQDDLKGARAAISRLVGRDTASMDAGACRRAAVESLSENLTDGFTSPLFWYALAGVPALVLFKIVSTMDSMVGYKTTRYVRFGWCGARLDDAMNYVPARLTWLLIVVVAAVMPACSARKAYIVGWRQHAVLPGPNSGWSEAGAAGALQRRLIGPMWMRGSLVTDLWLGDPSDPPLETRADLRRAIALVVATGVFAAALAGAALLTT